MPQAGELGASWSLVGTTRQPPTEAPPDDALIDAAQGEPACRDALKALAASGDAPAHFARSVYRFHPKAGPVADRDLTLTVATYDSLPDRAGQVRAVTSACTEPLTTRAGVRTVQMTVDSHSYPVKGAVGYTVAYTTDGLRYAYDYVVATRGQALVTATVTGPDTTSNGAALKRAVSLVTARLDGAQPTATG